MSDPRLEVDEQLRGFADDYLAATEPPPDRVDAALLALERRIGATGATSQPTVDPGAAASGVLTKLGVVVVVGGLVIAVVAGLAARRPGQPGNDRPPVTDAVARVEPPVTAPSPAPERPAGRERAEPVAATTPDRPEPGEPETKAPVEPGPARPRARAPKPKASAPPSPSNTLTDELLLLERARKALRGGQVRHALELLGEHGRRFPSGLLAREREATRVTAHCAAGDEAGARTTAERYTARYGRSSSFDPADPCQ